MFFKTSNPAALSAWDKFVASNQQLSEEARHLDDVLGYGCRSVFSSGIGGRRFHGVSFPGDERPFARELWTVQRAASGNSCRPRTSRIPAHLREQAKELTGVWHSNIPATYARTDALLPALGLDFSATIFGPLEWFRAGDVIYVMTGMKPARNDMAEILSDEYYKARKQELEASKT
ncbi:hypothetical protein DUQ17_22245 [Salmonella enterica subsp. diarizonae]|nr:hypothetical protein [Salmonella enterica subsp. diarizonae]